MSPLDRVEPNAAAAPNAPPTCHDPALRIAALESKVARLDKINRALMGRVERSMEYQGNGFSLFQTAIALEGKVRGRTEELERALRDLERSNRELARSNEDAETLRTRLSEAIEAISDGFVLCDDDDRLVLYNSKFISFLAGVGDMIRPGAHFPEVIAAAIERGILLPALAEPREWLARRLARHGAQDDFILGLPDERWVQVSERKSRDGDSVGVLTDVTAIRTVESERRKRELAEKSEQLHAALENLLQGVSLFDNQQRLVFWNSRLRDILDLPEELLRPGTAFIDILAYQIARGDAREAGAHRKLLEWIENPNSRVPLGFEYRRYDGIAIDVQRNRMPDGGFVSTYTDVTNQRRAAKALEEAKATLERRVEERTAELTAANEELRLAKQSAELANLSKTRFLAAASHDLLQPLNAARLFLSAMMDGEESPSRHPLVGRVDTALGSVENLLNALLDISKLDAGVLEPQISDFRIDAILSTLSADFALLAEEKGLRLRVRPCGAIVRTDQVLLRRVLQNFLSNAIRYTRRGGVLIGCRHRVEGLDIQVWDTGPGIPAEQQSAIFDEFYRIVLPGHKADHGLGLGLAIVQRAARTLGHRVRMRSTVGRGSMFSICVPFGEEAHIVSVQAPKPLGTAAGIAGSLAAFIENDRDSLEGMHTLLERWSCRVVSGTTTEAVIERLTAAGVRPDLIIADYHLDDSAIGLEAIEAMRRRYGAAIPGIVVTADRTPAVQEAVRRADLELLWKPVKPAELRSLIAHLRGS